MNTLHKSFFTILGVLLFTLSAQADVTFPLSQDLPFQFAKEKSFSWCAWCKDSLETKVVSMPAGSRVSIGYGPAMVGDGEVGGAGYAANVTRNSIGFMFPDAKETKFTSPDLTAWLQITSVTSSKIETQSDGTVVTTVEALYDNPADNPGFKIQIHLEDYAKLCSETQVINMKIILTDGSGSINVPELTDSQSLVCDYQHPVLSVAPDNQRQN